MNIQNIDVLKDIYRQRKSCRSFKKNGEPKIPAIHDACRHAPHASGGPRMKCYRICGENDLKKLSEACFDQKYVAECGEALIFCGKDTEAMLKSGHPKYIFDCAMACSYAEIMATAYGLGACVIGHFDPERVKKAVRIPDEVKPTIILIIGTKAGAGVI